MADGRTDGPRRAANNSAAARRRAVANEQRLLALGEAVDRRTGVVSKKPRTGRRFNTKRNWIIAAATVVLAFVVLIGGGYLYANYRFDQFHKVTVAGELQPISGQPINILTIGSDSRVGLSGSVANETGASSNLVAGQRSDSVKIIHIDPSAGTISVLSIPRDTMVSLLANQSLYGNANRINVNFGSGPSLVAQTITANWGIPINNTVVVSFSGLMDAVKAVGGVKVYFPYPSYDPYSGLYVSHAGCQMLSPYQALALSRSRHFYYNDKVAHAAWPGTTASDAALYAAGWQYDPTSDFGRIIRQDAFLNAVVDRAKHIYNPLTLNSFVSNLPHGITLDSNFSLNELIGLAVKFHSVNPAAIKYFTIPTVSGTSPALGDVLYTVQPQMQELLVNIFGSQLKQPTNPPPNTTGATPMPPVISTPTTTTTAPVKTKHSSSGAVTTTTTPVPTDSGYSFDPKAC